MTDNREQIALRFPAGTRSRLDALRLEGESLTAVILRGLAALEQPPPAIAPERLDTELDTRLAEIEARLASLESAARPTPKPATSKRKSGGKFEYPNEARDRAIYMLDQGIRLADIAAELEAMTGHRPAKTSLGGMIRRWKEKRQN